ncbi:MAG: 1,6-anhydro-N-acetylmuramyl-L-alanine amidase AmpD [Betaproteobacteria bacterium]|nr:MAG: 1,6-anhydro-N-acetylmuramyl-L-alanine amidase AmpD [Betaproteobacteria bacterium]
MPRRRGVLQGARFVASPNCDARPPGTAVTLLVLHSISLPPGHYGGDAVERLFTNRLDPAAHASFRSLAGLRVSSHFLLRRDGALLQFVPLQLRAWHAGLSRWRGRGRCNDFSIGVELEGSDAAAFADPQYVRLAVLVRALRALLPLREIAAHSDIAPGRKTDPGRLFDWSRWLRELARA